MHIHSPFSHIRLTAHFSAQTDSADPVSKDHVAGPVGTPDSLSPFGLVSLELAGPLESSTASRRAKRSRGHLQPEVSLALTLLSNHPSLYCTFLPDRRGAKRIAQILTCHPDLAGRCQGRYRVIPVRSEDGEDLGEDQEAIAREFAVELPRCFRQAALLGSEKGAGFGKAPGVVVLDVSEPLHL